MTKSGAPIRFGLLRLADSAPAVVAVRHGIFRELGLQVELSVEPSWANIADKLAYGLLDAASMLPPLALAATLGLRGPPGRLLVPMGLSAGGNTVTLGHAAATTVCDGAEPLDPQTAGRRFGVWLRAQSARLVLRWHTRFRRTICCCATGWRHPASIPTGISTWS